MVRKKIYHVCGGLERNYGDFALVKAQRDLISKEYGGPISWETIEIKYKTPITEKKVEEINEYGDLLLVGGGGLIMPGDGFETESGWQFNIEESLLFKIEVPKVFHALGYNIFPNNAGDRSKLDDKVSSHLDSCLGVSDLFSVRNHGSRNKLMENGLDGTRIEICPDPAIFCTPELNLHPFLEKRLNFEYPVIGLCLAGDRTDSRFKSGEIEHIINKINEAVKSIHPNSTILYIPHVSIYDQVYVELLQEILTVEFVNLASVCPWMYPESMNYVGALTKIYSSIDASIGMRGHSCIIPFGQGTPPIALGEHSKTKFFAKDINSVPVLNDCNNLEEVLYFELNDEDRKIERQEILEDFSNTSSRFIRRIVDML